MARQVCYYRLDDTEREPMQQAGRDIMENGTETDGLRYLVRLGWAMHSIIVSRIGIHKNMVAIGNALAEMTPEEVAVALKKIDKSGAV